MLLCCVLACACKEDVPLTVAMLGVLVIWKYKLPRLGAVLLVGGLLWSFVAFEIIIPHFYPGAQGNNFWYRYLQLGSTPLAAILNILTHPWIIFTTFLTIERFYYLAGLLRSAGFLSLLAPEWLLPALPSIAVNALSTDSNTYSGIFHYNATSYPLLSYCHSWHTSSHHYLAGMARRAHRQGTLRSVGDRGNGSPTIGIRLTARARARGAGVPFARLLATPHF